MASAFSASPDDTDVAAASPLIILPDLLLPMRLAPMPAASFLFDVATSSHTVGIYDVMLMVWDLFAAAEAADEPEVVADFVLSLLVVADDCAVPDVPDVPVVGAVYAKSPTL